MSFEIRSRAVSRPFLCCRSIAGAPPPWRIRSSSFLISVSRSTICRVFFSKAGDPRSTRVSIIDFTRNTPLVRELLWQSRMGLDSGNGDRMGVETLGEQPAEQASEDSDE